MTDTTTQRSDASTVEVGHIISRTQYYTVTAISEDQKSFTIKNTQGFALKVDRTILEAEMYSAHQHTEDVRVTRTELAAILENAGDTCFTVTFTKQPNDKAVAALLATIDLDEYDTDRKLRKLARTLLTGEERTLIGHLHRAEPKLGRSLVIDLQVEPGKNNIRAVDHRSITSLIYKNTRYSCD